MHKKLENIKETIKTTDKLNEQQKKDSLEKIEEWILYNEAFGTLKNALFEIDENFFDALFTELGLIEII